MLNNIVYMPSPELIALFKYILIITLFLHLTYMGLIVGSVFFSVAFNFLQKYKKPGVYNHFARYLVDTLLFNWVTSITLGIFPLIIVILVYAQLFQDKFNRLTEFFSWALVLLIPGLIFVYMYRNMLRTPGTRFEMQSIAGIVGLILILKSCLMFSTSLSLVKDPEKWVFILTPVDLFFSWNIVPGQLQFLVISLGLTGLGLLYFTFIRTDEGIKNNMDDEPRNFIKYFGISTMLIPIISIPLIETWNMVTMPVIAQSFTHVAFSQLRLVTLFITCYLLLRTLFTSSMEIPVFACILFLLFQFLTVTQGELTREYANRHQLGIFLAHAKEIKGDFIEKRRDVEIVDKISLLKIGKKVFSKRCMACHRFDKKVVGPPLFKVLPSYQDSRNELASFISSPVKKNPAYPSMPRLGLKSSEINAVVEYVMDQLVKHQEK